MTIKNVSIVALMLGFALLIIAELANVSFMAVFGIFLMIPGGIYLLWSR